MGKYSYGNRSERGTLLIEFFDVNNMYVMNSHFKKKVEGNGRGLVQIV